MPIIMNNGGGGVDPNAVVSIYLAINIFLIIISAINIFLLFKSGGRIKEGDKYYEDDMRPLIKRFLFDNYDGWLNHLPMIIIVVNGIALLFWTADFILNHFF